MASCAKNPMLSKKVHGCQRSKVLCTREFAVHWRGKRQRTWRVVVEWGLKRGAKAMPELAFQQKPRKGAALGIRRTVVSPGGAASRTRPLFRIVYGILTEKSPNRPGWLLFPRDFPRLAAHTSPACGGVAGCCAYTYLHVLPPSRLTNAGLTRSHGPSKTPYDQF